MANWELMRLWNSLTVFCLNETVKCNLPFSHQRRIIRLRRIIHLRRIIRLDEKMGRCSIQTDNSSDFILLFIRLFKRILRTNYSSRIHIRQINSTHFSIQTRLECVLAFHKKKNNNEGDVVFYLNGLDRTRKSPHNRRFVEQNMASKVEALTRKNKQKSQGKGKTSKKNTWSEGETFIFAAVLSSLDGRDKPWDRLYSQKTCIEEKVVYQSFQVFFSST